MKKTVRHFNIPVFVPELACPNRCVFCNQYKISGTLKAPNKEEVIQTIETYLSSIRKLEADKQVQLAFFGGNFTGIPVEEQERYLQWVSPYLQSGEISGIRLSTRPDYIDRQKLDLLANYQVQAIELGVQSLDDEVLRLSGRGHTVKEVDHAVALIKEYDMELGLQMMIGLPGDTPKKAMQTAKQIVAYQADTSRIYPTLVIPDTSLATMYQKGEYTPLSLEEAVMQAKGVYLLLENAGIRVIRVGLHPSEDLLNGKNYLAGPFHVSFKEMMLSAVWKDIFSQHAFFKGKDRICIRVAPGELNYAIGYQSVNRNFLLRDFKEVKFIPDTQLKGRDFYVDHCG